MYILTIYGKETDGAYSVNDSEGEQILYLFEGEDDAMRYAMMLEEDGSPDMHVIEVEDEITNGMYIANKLRTTIIRALPDSYRS